MLNYLPLLSWIFLNFFSKRLSDIQENFNHNEMFCFQMQIYPRNISNVSGNVLHWDYGQNNSKIQNKTSNKVLACSSLMIINKVNNSCWKFEPDSTNATNNIKYIMNILNQFSFYLTDSSYIKHLLNNYFQPLCFLGNESSCSLPNATHLSLSYNFSLFSSYQTQYPFSNVYSINYNYTFDSSFKICYLPAMIFKTISCLEIPYTPSENLKSYPHAFFKRSSDKAIIRNKVCVASAAIEKDIEISNDTEVEFIFTVFFSISLIFLMMFIIECFIIEDFRKYPRSIIMCLSIFLFLSRSLGIILMLVKIPSSSPICFVLIFIYRIVYLGSFCWIGISGYDLWCTFKNVKASSNGDVNLNYKRNPMLKYIFFAVGFPAVVSTAEILTLIFSPPACLYHFIIRENSCLLWSMQVQNLFYSIPTVIILLTNILFFIITFKKIKKSNRLVVFTGYEQTVIPTIWKLTILFGFPWIFSVISDILSLYHNTVYLYYIAIAVSSSQAIFIFLFFGCGKASREKLKINLHKLKVFPVSNIITSLN